MGCCQSSPKNEVSQLSVINFLRYDLPLTEVETIKLETFLSGMPNQCRQTIAHLPKRQLLNFYQYHEKAIAHGLKKEWTQAMFYEHRVIKGLQAMLPTDKDHYIFFNFYNILSASFVALGELEGAIEGIHVTLGILLKHTPMDYGTISKHYYHLANVFKFLQDWKATAQYLTKAIETGRLMVDLNEEYIGVLETELQRALEQLAEDAAHSLTSFGGRRRSGSVSEFRYQTLAEIIIVTPTQEKLDFHKEELNGLPYKQTEL